jgi:hypothetical protein
MVKNDTSISLHKPSKVINYILQAIIQVMSVPYSESPFKDFLGTMALNTKLRRLNLGTLHVGSTVSSIHMKEISLHLSEHFVTIPWV